MNLIIPTWPPSTRGSLPCSLVSWTTTLLTWKLTGASDGGYLKRNVHHWLKLTIHTSSLYTICLGVGGQSNEKNHNFCLHHCRLCNQGTSIQDSLASMPSRFQLDVLIRIALHYCLKTRTSIFPNLSSLICVFSNMVVGVHALFMPINSMIWHYNVKYFTKN